MAWTASITSIAQDPSNANILLTISLTNGTTTQTRVVPSSTWTPAAISAYVQQAINLLDQRDIAAAALATGTVSVPASVITHLQTVWGTTTLPSGVTGTALAGTDTAAQKIAKLNAWTVVGSATKAVLPTYSIYNAIVPSEFQALTAANQQYVRDILGMGTVDASVGTNVRAVISSIFAGKVTLTNLAALVAPFDAPATPWWQSIGSAAQISASTVAAAGLS